MVAVHMVHAATMAKPFNRACDQAHAIPGVPSSPASKQCWDPPVLLLGVALHCSAGWGKLGAAEGPLEGRGRWVGLMQGLPKAQAAPLPLLPEAAGR